MRGERGGKEEKGKTLSLGYKRTVARRKGKKKKGGEYGLLLGAKSLQGVGEKGMV